MKRAVLVGTVLLAWVLLVVLFLAWAGLEVAFSTGGALYWPAAIVVGGVTALLPMAGLNDTVKAIARNSFARAEALLLLLVLVLVGLCWPTFVNHHDDVAVSIIRAGSWLERAPERDARVETSLSGVKVSNDDIVCYRACYTAMISARREEAEDEPGDLPGQESEDREAEGELRMCIATPFAPVQLKVAAHLGLASIALRRNNGGEVTNEIRIVRLMSRWFCTPAMEEASLKACTQVALYAATKASTSGDAELLVQEYEACFERMQGRFLDGDEHILIAHQSNMCHLGLLRLRLLQKDDLLRGDIAVYAEDRAREAVRRARAFLRRGGTDVKTREKVTTDLGCGLTNLAIFHLRAGRWSEATNSLEEAAKCGGPAIDEAYCYLIVARVCATDSDGTAEVCDVARKRAGNVPLIHAVIGWACVDSSVAEREYRIALGLKEGQRLGDSDFEGLAVRLNRKYVGVPWTGMMLKNRGWAGGVPQW